MKAGNKYTSVIMFLGGIALVLCIFSLVAFSVKSTSAANLKAEDDQHRIELSKLEETQEEKRKRTESDEIYKEFIEAWKPYTELVESSKQETVQNRASEIEASIRGNLEQLTASQFAGAVDIGNWETPFRGYSLKASGRRIDVLSMGLTASGLPSQVLLWLRAIEEEYLIARIDNLTIRRVSESERVELELRMIFPLGETENKKSIRRSK